MDLRSLRLQLKMGILVRSQNNPSEQNDSKQRLIEAALELFSSKGFHAVSVREVCDRAQVNCSLVSYYFAGKDGLLAAVLEEMTKQGVQAIEHFVKTFDSREDFEIRLRQFIDGIIEFYLSHSDLLRLFLEQLEKEQPEAEKVFSVTLLETFNVFKRFLSQGREAGFLRARSDNDHILLLQFLSPFLSLMRTENCSRKFYKASLSHKPFRQELIDQIIYISMP